MFQLTDVSKRYAHKQGRVTALQSTTLRIAPGEFVAVVGPSGCGKTTLLSILGGMLAPTSGQVLLEGQSVYDLPPAKRAKLRLRKIGFVFQTFNLVPYLSALENVQIPLMLGRASAAESERRASDLLARVGLSERMHHKPSELSVGQQQRVALARTLANDPAVILADEPTGNLDPQTREQVLDFLAELSGEGRTVIVVTHDPAAAKRAGRIIKLADGAVSSDVKVAIQRVA
ncbi:MAG: ABC transporter ATP-binding protein [Planctomycetes bacterium]|nr:ABC transporter ATP-binding protein [Planctomycetota bacterium]